MHFMYGSARENASEARRLYSRRFSNRPCPNVKMFNNVHNRICETGTLKICMYDTGRNTIVRTVEFEEDALQRFYKNLRISTRSVADEVGASNKTVWKNYLKEEKT